MNELLVWIVRGLTVLLGSCYPAMALKEPALDWGKDPAYAMYQDYRYTYDTYVYLFWDESTGAGPENPGTMTPEALAVKGGWNRLGEATEGEGGNRSGVALVQESADIGGYGTGEGQEGNEDQGGLYGESHLALAQLKDYDYLMKNFYSIHASTTAPRDLMKAQELLSMDLHIEKDSRQPQILIYHTHSQESYADYGPENPEATVVGIGNYLTSLLTAKGWNVIHDTSTYDIQGGNLDRNRAYNYALEGISRILQENPSVQVVLDLHRDGVKESLHLVSQVEGKPTANIMFFQGMSRTPEGEIEYLPNPYLKENLAFTLQMQLDGAERFPGFTRKIYMKGLRYNLHLRPRSALIEVGAQTNSGQEAMNSMEPLAELLDRVLQGE